MSVRAAAVAATLSGALVFAVAAPAAAQSTIKDYGARPSYGVELEPHLALGWIDPPGYGTGEGIGLGGRATFELIGHGFIPSINNSVGLGVGLDYIHYYGDGSGPRGTCTQFTDAPAGTHVCTQVDGGKNGDDSNYLYIPVVLQWNFWLARHWSAFGEIGAALRLQDGNDIEFSPLISWAGGRYHINDHTTLTLRLGLPFVLTPYITFGASFLL